MTIDSEITIQARSALTTLGGAVVLGGALVVLLRSLVPERIHSFDVIFCNHG